MAPNGNFSNGLKGHLWEQFILPNSIKDQILWSPANTGPLFLEKQVLTIHDLAPIDFPQAMKPAFSNWYKFLIPKLARKVRKIITVSEFSKSRIIELCNISEDKIKVIPNGISNSFTRRSYKESEKILELYSIPKDSEYLFTVSSIEPRKNLASMLRAWESVVKKLPENIYFVIAGSFGSTSIFNNVEIPSNLTRVIFTGRVDDTHLPMLYSCATSLIYMSLYEGFGLPVLESIACGTPALVANNTALPDALNGFGISLNPNNISEISDGILELLLNRDKYKISIQDMIKVHELHSWESVSKVTRSEILSAI